MSKKQKSVLYEQESGKVELQIDSDQMIFATQDEIAKIFDTSIQNISLHLINLFKEEEVIENRVIKDSLITAKDGKQYKTKLYNLDAIIAVGYRVNSKKATKFRIWATNILKSYILDGYALNERKLTKDSDKIEDVHEALDFIESSERAGKLKGTVSIRISRQLI